MSSLAYVNWMVFLMEQIIADHCRYLQYLSFAHASVKKYRWLGFTVPTEMISLICHILLPYFQMVYWIRDHSRTISKVEIPATWLDILYQSAAT